MTGFLRKALSPRSVTIPALCAAVAALVVLGHRPPVYPQPDEVFIDNNAGAGKGSRPGVFFPHALHMDALECLECHHDYRDGRNVLDEEDLEEDGTAVCAACHTDESPTGLEKAYHRQCIGCHRRLNRQEDTALPVLCRDCHPEK